MQGGSGELCLLLGCFKKYLCLKGNGVFLKGVGI